MIIDQLHPAIVAGLLAAAVATAALVLIWNARAWAERNDIYFAAFASGMLIATALLHLAPESVHAFDAAPIFILAGFLGLYVLGAVFRDVDQEGDIRPVAAIVPFVGIGLHSFIDGVVYAVSFSASMFTGVLTASGLIVHEFSEGIILFALLLRTNMKALYAFVLAFLGAAATTPLGAAAAVFFLGDVSETQLAAALAIAAGALIYVGATHLSEHVGREGPRRTVIALLLGVALAAVVVQLGHGHENSHAREHHHDH